MSNVGLVKRSPFEVWTLEATTTSGREHSCYKVDHSNYIVMATDIVNKNLYQDQLPFSKLGGIYIQDSMLELCAYHQGD